MASIEGKLSRVGLTDIIQMECLSGRQGTIAVSALSGSGLIDYMPGRITHAEFDDAVDHEAMIRMLMLDDGWFRVETQRENAPVTIEQNWQNFLMNCVVDADEREDACGTTDRDQHLARKPVQGLLDQLPGALGISIRQDDKPPVSWFEQNEQLIANDWALLDSLATGLATLLEQPTYQIAGRETRERLSLIHREPPRVALTAFSPDQSLLDNLSKVVGVLNRTL